MKHERLPRVGSGEYLHVHVCIFFPCLQRVLVTGSWSWIKGVYLAPFGFEFSQNLVSFSFENNQKLQGDMSGEYGTYRRNIVFGQNILNQMWGMRYITNFACTASQNQQWTPGLWWSLEFVLHSHEHPTEVRK